MDNRPGPLRRQGTQGGGVRRSERVEREQAVGQSGADARAPVERTPPDEGVGDDASATL